MTNMEKLFTPQEVADQLKIKKHTVYDLIKRGELECSKVGKQIRISVEQINQYLNATHPIQSQEPTSFYPENSLLKNDYLLHQTGIILCGQDPALDILSTLLSAHPNGLPVLRSHMNNYNGLYSLYFDKVHIVASHLWDGASNTYNTNAIQHFLPGEEIAILHLFKRMQGFYVLTYFNF